MHQIGSTYERLYKDAWSTINNKVVPLIEELIYSEWTVFKIYTGLKYVLQLTKIPFNFTISIFGY